MTEEATVPCSCTFVPPHVMRELETSGDKDVAQLAKRTAQESDEIRHRRAGHIVGDTPKKGSRTRRARAQALSDLAPTTAGFVAAGAAGREVYDSGNQWAQRVSLARGEGDPATSDADVGFAHDFAGHVREYYANALGRRSIDNKGLNLVLNVHFGTSFMNAFWDGDEMTFGDGDGQVFSSFAASLDVVAHELTHGVVQHTAGLVYQDQPGALNEHFADVFGIAVSHAVNGSTDWLIGNEIMGPRLYGEALRSMKAPGTAYDNPLMGKDPQPAHMNNLYTGPLDYGGVHINSGIPNRAFYLVASELGVDSATRIWYRSLQLLGPTAQFADAASMLAESARVLTKAGNLPQGATQCVRSAFREVGL